MEATWLPYELHPDVPVQGMSFEEYFPPSYLTRIAAAPYVAMAEQEGLVMKRGGRLINSRLALAAAEFARDHDRFEAMHKALFKAYWERTADLASLDHLKRIGAEQGLDADELGAALEEGRYEELLDANRREAVQVGINAIPAHVFGMRFLVMGAHPFEILKQVAERVESEPPATG